MSKYPKPIRPPSSVSVARIVRKKELLTSARQGVLIRTSIILFELGGVFYFGSSALFMDALSSSIDVLFSLILILCIRLAAKPPDEDHPFGHGRYEPLIGLQLGVFLGAIGGVMIFQQTFQLSQNISKESLDPHVWIIPFCAVILLELCYQRMMQTAKKQNSPALAADAFHYRVDGLTSLVATVALIAAAYYPQWSIAIDHIGAIFIGFVMIIVGIYAIRNNLNQLLDKIPEQHYFELVRNAALTVQGVHDTEKIRIQLYGPDAHVDIDIEVDPNLPVNKAHKISQEVRVEIQKAWPLVRDVTVHVEPFYPDDH